MKSVLHLLVYLFLFSAHSFSYVSLEVLDPQNWRGGQGTIEEASLSIKQAGIYAKYELDLTFSARNLGFEQWDTLEVALYFDLPENAIVCDSWLWIEDEPVKAIIMDKWTASSIYEEIVARRRDPSILYKRWTNEYELRIFPMAGNSTRKVRLIYLVPVDWKSSVIATPLPTNLLISSYNPVASFPISVWADPQLPLQIEGHPEIGFQSISDSLGNYFIANIPYEAYDYSYLYLVSSFQPENGIFISRYENENEGFYQMVLFPSKVLDINSANKIAVLLDYDVLYTTTTKSEMLSNLRTNLLQNLSSKDSFNIIISNASIYRISEIWLPSDSNTIDGVFQALNENLISNYSNLESLLANGIDFIKSVNNDGSILLVSSSDQVGELQQANGLLNDLLELMEIKIPINVINFQNMNFSFHWIGDNYYYGNEYFYINITRLTSGNYYDRNTGSFRQNFSDAFNSLNGSITSFDLHTKLSDGFCYARYNIGSTTNAINFNKPIIQVGKYRGNFPFIIEISGVYKSTPFSQSFTIHEYDVFEADSLSEEAWAGNYIAHLESQSRTNNIINEIIYYSINERVLSEYSAFICLEPNMEWTVCYDCMDDFWPPVDVSEDTVKTENQSLLLSAFPNPFNSQVTIKFSLPASTVLKDINFRIYNILGEVIKTFNADQFQYSNNFEFRWDGRNDYGTTVASGIYFFVVTTPEKNYSLKLLLMK